MPTIDDIYYVKYSGANLPKTPIILIHGIGEDQSVWDVKLRRLSGFDVYSIDLPGHGKSRGVAAQSVKQYVNQMINFLAGIGVYQAIFIGHALGSAIALQMAVEEPNLVAGLGIISGAASYSVGTGFLQEFRSRLTLPDALAKLEQSYAHKMTAYNGNEKTFNFSHTNQPSLWYTDMRACATFDLRRQLHLIKQPAFIAAGRLDRVVPFQNSLFLANQIPHAEFSEYKNNGHLFLLEEPARLAEEITSFLNTHYV